jgi:RNA polymerase-binding transcription factor DksA
MDILSVKDQDDGSCIMECSFSEKEVDLLLNYAVNDILRKQIKIMKNEKECFDCGEEINSETIKEFPDTEICSECMNNE